MGDDLNWDSMSEVQREIKRWADERFPDNRGWKLALDKLTYHEIPEMFQHLMKKGFVGVGSELADCFILLLDLAELWNVDIGAEIRAKMEVNYARRWRVDPVTGLSQHVDGDQNPDWCPGCTPDNCSGCAEGGNGAIPRVYAEATVKAMTTGEAYVRTEFDGKGIRSSPIETSAVRGEPVGSGGDDTPPVGSRAQLSGGDSCEVDLPTFDSNDFPQFFR